MKNLIEKLKALRIYAATCISFYTGVKENKWVNVHYEFESADSGAWFTSGDSFLFEFTDRWIYFLGIPIYRLDFKSENKGVYDAENYT